MLQERLSRTRQYRSGRARPIALGVIALCCGLAFRVDPGGLQLWATGVAQASEAREVTIDNYTFSPGTLTVPVGTTVTWTNRDFDVHTVTADDNPPTFKSAASIPTTPSRSPSTKRGRTLTTVPFTHI